jgi:mannose-P-dolichol utilization defect protein 1
MESFEKLMSFFVTPQCYEELFYKFNVFNTLCVKMVISKGLGYAILAGSLMLRVPQILKIVQAKSGQGISLLSEVLMILAGFGSMAYGYTKQFPIAAYGDIYFLYIQEIIILFLILYYQNRVLNAFGSVLIISALTSSLFLGLIEPKLVFYLNGLSTIFSISSKLIQAVSNFQNGSTGNLSAITLVLQLAGTVARIFTSIQETGDFTLILTYVVVSVANLVLVLQLVYYWNSDSSQKIKEKKQK